MPRQVLILPNAQLLKRRREIPSTLPQPLTSLVGRKQEVADALRLLRHGHVRLLTLTGPPGVGKTRLCIQIASRLLPGFRNDVYFVPLAAISDPYLAVQSIAQALGLRTSGQGDTLSAVRDYLQDRRALLLLDNFEQIIAAGSLISDLLHACPQLRVVVTSREPLHITGEQEFPVPPLKVPGREFPIAGKTQTQGDLYSGLGTIESVALFVQRARAVRPDFELNTGNALAVAEICARLDGLPLAIELAAARVKTLTPSAILERLEHRLHLLTVGAHDVPLRQQTLRDAIEWSYTLLNSDEQILLRRLSVFVGGCFLDAIETVCNYDGNLESEPLALVSSLVNKSLLMLTEVEGEPRFRMLETIREFAMECLQDEGSVGSGEAEELHRRHALYFTALVEQCMPHISGSDQASWLEKLTRDNDNLRAVLSWSFATNNGADSIDGSSQPEEHRLEIGLNLAVLLSRFWHRQGYLREGIKWLETAIKAAAPKPDMENATNSYAHQLLAAMNGAGNMSQMCGDYSTARSYRNRSLTLAKSLGNEEAVGNELSALGEMCNDTGDYAAARGYLEESLAIGRKLGAEEKVAGRLSALAYSVMSLGSYAEARDFEEESLAIRRNLGDVEGIGRSLYNLASLEGRIGNYSQARIYAQEVLGIARRLGFKQGMAHALSIIGNADHAKKDYPAALASLHESLALFHETGRKLGEIEVASVIGMVLADTDQWVKAASLLSALATIRREMANVILGDAEKETEVIERRVQSLRSKRERERWQAAWDEGSNMTFEQAVAYALSISMPATNVGATSAEMQANPPANEGADIAGVNVAETEGLTERELQIVRLIAQSKSNVEIGQALVVAKRTVETHVGNILSKLGFTSRGQVATWAIRKGLVDEERR